jgi:hypothetical protein
MATLLLGRPDVSSDGAIVLSRNIGGGGWRNFRIGIDNSLNLCLGDYGSLTTGNTWPSTQFSINYSSGNVGIGTANSVFKLSVQGSTYINSSLTVSNGLILSGGNSEMYAELKNQY